MPQQCSWLGQRIAHAVIGQSADGGASGAQQDRAASTSVPLHPATRLAPQSQWRGMASAPACVFCAEHGEMNKIAETVLLRAECSNAWLSAPPARMLLGDLIHLGDLCAESGRDASTNLSQAPHAGPHRLQTPGAVQADGIDRDQHPRPGVADTRTPLRPKPDAGRLKAPARAGNNGSPAPPARASGPRQNARCSVPGTEHPVSVATLAR